MCGSPVQGSRRGQPGPRSEGPQTARRHRQQRTAMLKHGRGQRRQAHSCLRVCPHACVCVCVCVCVCACVRAHARARAQGMMHSKKVFFRFTGLQPKPSMLCVYAAPPTRQKLEPTLAPTAEPTALTWIPIANNRGGCLHEKRRKYKSSPLLCASPGSPHPASSCAGSCSCRSTR